MRDQFVTGTPVDLQEEAHTAGATPLFVLKCRVAKSGSALSPLCLIFTVTTWVRHLDFGRH